MKFTFGMGIILIILSNNAFCAATEWVAFTAPHGHIMIDSKVGGVAGKTILDTGAQIHTINSIFLDAHQMDFSIGKSIQLIGIHGKESTITYNNVPVTLFDSDMELDNLARTTINLPDIQLILGVGFFEKMVVQIDYPNSKLRLIERDSVDLKSLKNVRSQLDRISNNLIVEITINDTENVWVQLDTGFTGGLYLPRSFALDNQLFQTADTQNVKSKGITATIATAEEFKLDSVIFGPFELENVQGLTPAEGEPFKAISAIDTGSMHRIRGKKVKGLLGFDLLKHFIVTIDYRKGYLHIATPE